MKKSTPKKRKLRVLILDSDAITRSRLAQLIDVERDLFVCGEAKNVDETLEKIPFACPDVLVLDIDPMDGVAVSAVNRLRWEHPVLPLVTVSLREESVQGHRMMQAGVAGFVTKAEAAWKVVPAIRRVLKGGIYVKQNHTQKKIGDRSC